MSYPICKTSMSNIPIATIVLAIAAALFASGCATAPEPSPLPLTRAEDRATSPVIREALPEPVIFAPVAATPDTPNAEAIVNSPGQGSMSTQGANDALGAWATASSTPAKPSPSTAEGKATTKDRARKGAKNAPKVAASTPPTLASAMPSAASPPVVAQPASIPAGTLYICNASANGENQQTAIEFEPRVKTLCARHPEMGVCQYERELCRAAGGRVYTPGGDEITKQTEAEYDKKVLRVRFKAG